ncbi:coiled-coil domain-containing protein 180 isoform X1 [Lates japonicus]|uniref:Coiled-coil domain-containing protein 180 isoform X1 n=1 Tax=Lates japonicus TaxID=270547 RepID=A0AAD3QWB7_LATJO|nr:coiled-coil domain-containing protein 180 isoform X1 [Lates japonicus]
MRDRGVHLLRAEAARVQEFTAGEEVLGRFEEKLNFLKSEMKFTEKIQKLISSPRFTSRLRWASPVSSPSVQASSLVHLLVYCSRAGQVLMSSVNSLWRTNDALLLAAEVTVSAGSGRPTWIWSSFSHLTSDQDL